MEIIELVDISVAKNAKVILMPSIKFIILESSARVRNLEKNKLLFWEKMQVRLLLWLKKKNERMLVGTRVISLHSLKKIVLV